MTDVLPALPAAPTPARPRVLLVGTALATAAVVMGFAGLIGTYLAVRSNTLAAGGRWFGEDVAIPLTPANMALFTFLLSAVTMHWAVYAVGNNDRQHAYLALGLTMLFGFCVINATTFVYSQSAVSMDDGASGLLFFTITGAHLVMIVVALIYAALMTFRTLGGQYAGRDREGIIAAAVFWYATIAVFAFIWYAIYITK
jgi:heme/copper-type cytochrome/quinol oxidase subunit 3